MFRFLILVLCVLPAIGADREFREIVQAISDHAGTRPTRIPFMGLVNAFAFAARPAGASHIDLAVFENLHGRQLDPSVVKRLVGSSWKPFVQVTSRRAKAESTLIYMREDGRQLHMLITAIEPNEATVVQLKLNPESFRRWVDNPRHKFED